MTRPLLIIGVVTGLVIITINNAESLLERLFSKIEAKNMMHLTMLLLSNIMACLIAVGLIRSVIHAKGVFFTCKEVRV